MEATDAEGRELLECRGAEIDASDRALVGGARIRNRDCDRPAAISNCHLAAAHRVAVGRWASASRMRGSGITGRRGYVLVGVSGGTGEALDGDGIDRDDQVVVRIVVAAGAEAGVEPGACFPERGLSR